MESRNPDRLVFHGHYYGNRNLGVMGCNRCCNAEQRIERGLSRPDFLQALKVFEKQHGKKVCMAFEGATCITRTGSARKSSDQTPLMESQRRSQTAVQGHYKYSDEEVKYGVAEDGTYIGS